MSAVRDAILRWQRRGMDAVTAANLTAYALGLPPYHNGWTSREIEHLVALRWEVEHGRHEPKPPMPRGRPRMCGPMR